MVGHSFQNYDIVYVGFSAGYTCFYYSTIAPFYHIRAKERAKYATLLHCRTGQKYGLKRSDKKAAQNEPNFALFTSSDLDFLTDELFTDMDFLTEQTETSETVNVEK